MKKIGLYLVAMVGAIIGGTLLGYVLGNTPLRALYRSATRAHKVLPQVAAAFAQQSSSHKAFTVKVEQRIYDANWNAVRIAFRRITAQRADGARVVAYESHPNGTEQVSVHRREITFADSKLATAFDDSGVVTTITGFGQAYSWQYRLAPESDCTSSYIQMLKNGSRDQTNRLLNRMMIKGLEGGEAVSAVETTAHLGPGNRDSIWFAPDFDCESIGLYAPIMDDTKCTPGTRCDGVPNGEVAVTKLLSAKFGEPDPALFSTDGLEEVVPADAWAKGECDGLRKLGATQAQIESYEVKMREMKAHLAQRWIGPAK